MTELLHVAKDFGDVRGYTRGLIALLIVGLPHATPGAELHEVGLQ